MNCANHTEASAVAFCRTCGKPLCANCTRDVRGVIYCEQCLAARMESTLPPGPPPVGVPAAVAATDERLPSPGVAAVLGFIPGVGAMYNGQFMKGFIHVMVFVCMIWMADRFGPIMVPVFFAYFFYSVFDAYKTAHAIELGQPVPDPFGLEQMLGGTTPVRQTVPASGVAGGTPATGDECSPCSSGMRGAPTGAIILIGLGVLFLLDNLGLFEFHWVHRLWPLILIVIGGWLFVKRWNR